MGAELKRIIDQVSREKGLEREVLIEAVEEAIKSAVRKRYGARLDLEVSFNRETGELEVYQYRVVTDRVEDEQTEISLEEARELDPNSEIGDSLGIQMDISSLGRIAAQSARQVIIQRMKSAECDVIYQEFKDRVGEVVNGIIQRYDRGNVIVNLGRTEAILPKEGQIPRESYRRGDRLRALIVDVRRTVKDAQVVLSRSHPDFLIKLFSLEVPEIAEGIVSILGVAREPGSRSKIAVSSTDSDVDPVGACVGMRGSRVQAVVQELRGEKIDIVPWNPDPAKYVYNALAPAECSRVIVDEANRSLEVIVPDDQLSLAIGRQGQNVRLAAKLLDWKIDVKSETRYAHYQDPEYVRMLDVPGMTENIADKLYEAGITSVERLAQAGEEVLESVVIKRALFQSLVEEARKMVAEAAEAADETSEGGEGGATHLEQGPESPDGAEEQAALEGSAREDGEGAAAAGAPGEAPVHDGEEPLAAEAVEELQGDREEAGA